MSKKASANQISEPDIQIPEAVTGLLRPYYDRFLIDDSMSDVDTLLLSVYLIENNKHAPGANKKDAENLFHWLGRKGDSNFRVAMFRAKKDGLLDVEAQNVLTFQIGGLKYLENKIGLVGKNPVRLIKAGENFSAIRLFEEFLTNEVHSDKIYLCDAYISPATLFPFSVLKNRTKEIRILFSNIVEPEKFDSYKAKFARETGISVEVKKSYKIHDRYLITDDNCWTIGTSIQDFGNKDTIIQEVVGVRDSLKDLFDERWSEAHR